MNIFKSLKIKYFPTLPKGNNYPYHHYSNNHDTAEFTTIIFASKEKH